MSYDLLFLVPQDASPVTERQFQEYFSRRPDYKVQDGQAWYRNENTGVYFCFDWGEPNEQCDVEEDAEGPPDDGYVTANVAFNINYVRPHFFGLEAAPELEAFVGHFGLRVEDPQLDGMQRGPFSAEGFLRGWNHGNRFSYFTVCRHEDKEEQTVPDVVFLPTERLEKTWRWNFHRLRLQERLGEEIFVPTLFFMRRNGRAGTFFVWPDGIPVAVPPTDWVVVVRGELAPRNWLGKSKKDMIILPYSDVHAATTNFMDEGLDDEAGAYRRMTYVSPPAPIVKFVRNLKTSNEVPVGIAADQVLNQELLDEAKQLSQSDLGTPER